MHLKLFTQFHLNLIGQMMAKMKFNEIFETTDVTFQDLPVVVVDEDLMEIIQEYAADTEEMDLEDLYDIVDDWVFEGRN